MPKLTKNLVTAFWHSNYQYAKSSQNAVTEKTLTVFTVEFKTKQFVNVI